MATEIEECCENCVYWKMLEVRRKDRFGDFANKHKVLSGAQCGNTFAPCLRN
jgi:hypothetical protein